MYITTKKVSAIPMSVGEYEKNIEKINHDRLDDYDGYMITDEYGAEEWVCEALFKERYRGDTENMTIGDAVEYLKVGKLVARSDWDYKGMFLFMRPEDTLELDTVIKAKSIPYSFKEKVVEEPNTEKVKFGAYICMRRADGSVCNGWLPSIDDLLSNDWFLASSNE